jgi:uncharacterized protein
MASREHSRWDNTAMAIDQPFVLDSAQTRVLGALVEKEITTPDYYPLSLNALLNACNQRSNREPVMDLNDDQVRSALEGLRECGLAGPARDADSRVTKYEHRLGEMFNFDRTEIALLCVLLLRGPQTAGELRGRTERMHRFDEISDVVTGLRKLTERQPPLVAVLARQPGTKEVRYSHSLSGQAEAVHDPPPDSSANSPTTWTGQDMRIARLESAMADLRAEFAQLRRRVEDLAG